MRTERALLLTIGLTTSALAAGVVLIHFADHARELSALRARVAKLEADALSHQRTLAGDAWPVDWRANDPALVLPLPIESVPGPWNSQPK